jgi:D-tagatose-1,6-bisphosphate aldolase subunit GatZ/KbaZ
MLENSKDWENYYRGTTEKKRLKLKFSYSDRSRYYLNHPRVQRALKTLFANLNSTGIPMNLLSQFMPSQADKVRKGLVANDPHSLVISRIADVIADYTFAVSI